jgi:membrane-associated phospholipid phosphatase
MGLALVYLGEHYVVDVVAGVVYALVVHLLVSRWERARDSRRTAVSVAPDASD